MYQQRGAACEILPILRSWHTRLGMNAGWCCPNKELHESESESEIYRRAFLTILLVRTVYSTRTHARTQHVAGEVSGPISTWNMEGGLAPFS